MEYLNQTQKHRRTATITAKYPIEVPLHEAYSTKCVFRVWFGSKKYYIGKGKAFLQACEQMAIIIARGLTTINTDQGDWFYHVITYIRRARVIRGVAELIHDGTDQPESDLLNVEQEWLNRCKNDPDCLNNNFDAYIPKWIPAKQVAIFKKSSNAANKNNGVKNRASNSRKKH